MVSDVDVLDKSIAFLTNNQQQSINESGKYGIGIFNFTYYMYMYLQHIDNECTDKCSDVTPGDNGTNQQVTSSPADASLTPTDNSTNQQMHKPSSLPWAWIAVANLFMLFTIFFFTISIALLCINRKMAKKLNESKKGNACKNNGE